jgi:hypothetical protein
LKDKGDNMSDLITRVEPTIVTVTLDNNDSDEVYSSPNYLEVTLMQNKGENDDDTIQIQIGCEGCVKNIGQVKRNGIFAEFVPANIENIKGNQQCENCKHWVNTETSNRLYSRRCSNPINARKFLIPSSELITYITSWCEHWERRYE